MSLGFFGPKPPFQLDQTQSGKPSTATIAATEYTDGEGQIWLHSRLPRTHGGPATSNRPSLGMVVRNLSGSAFTPTVTVANLFAASYPTYCGKCVAMKTDGTTLDVYVSGFSGASSTTLGGKNYPMCHLAPAIAANDLAWAIVGGPAWVATGDDAGSDNDIDAGEWVSPDHTTAGRVEAQDVTVAAGAATFAEIYSAIGRAMIDLGGANKDDYALPILVSGL
jgi:hypothetical protein